MKRIILLSLIFTCHNSIAQEKPNLDEVDDACVVIQILDYKGRSIGHGSGFFIDRLGTVATNYHVVDEGTSFKVIRELDNGARVEYDVDEIISGDEGIDIATIKVDIPKNTIVPYLPIASDIPSKGDNCWAIGTPADPIFMNTISTGIVSNFHLNGFGDKWEGIMLQTTAEIAGGSSGGALVNSKGEVIGLTCGGVTTEAGARASINLAISSKEFENLSKIGKENLIKPSMIPCEIAFYTNDKYAGDAYLYVDRLYAGKLTTYFYNNMRPECGQEGTITRSVFQGTHTWQVYYASTGRWYYGTFDAQPGGCFRVKVNQDSYNRNSYNWFQPRELTKIEDKNLHKWGIYTGLSMTQTGRGLPVPIYVERSFFENELSLRGHLHWISRKEDYGIGITYSTKYFGLGLDVEKLFIEPYQWDWTIGAFGYYRSVKLISDYTDYDYSTWPATEVTVNDVDNYSHLFTGARFGGDRYLTQRLYFTMDMGLGYRIYFEKNNGFGADLNLLLGYRF